MDLKKKDYIRQKFVFFTFISGQKIVSIFCWHFGTKSIWYYLLYV